MKIVDEDHLANESRNGILFFEHALAEASLTPGQQTG